MNKKISVIIFVFCLNCSFSPEQLLQPYPCGTQWPKALSTSAITGYWVDSTYLKFYSTDTVFQLLVFYADSQYYRKQINNRVNPVYSEEYGRYSVFSNSITFARLKIFRIVYGDNRKLDTLIDTSSNSHDRYSEFYGNDSTTLDNYSLNHQNPDCMGIIYGVKLSRMDSVRAQAQMWIKFSKPQ
jgi:hypothetical protein